MSAWIEVVTTEAQVELVLPLVAEYQRFYRRQPDAQNNRAFFLGLLRQAGLGGNPLGRQLVAFDGTAAAPRAVGFATLYILPSSLTARPYCVLNDLFVISECRNRGIARELIAAACQLARVLGFPSIEWMTEKQNVSAQHLYDRLGASRSEWIYYGLATDEASARPVEERDAEL